MLEVARGQLLARLGWDVTAAVDTRHWSWTLRHPATREVGRLFATFTSQENVHWFFEMGDYRVEIKKALDKTVVELITHVCRQANLRVFGDYKHHAAVEPHSPITPHIREKLNAWS